MPSKTEVKTHKIVAYNPDGSRQTLGYRVESLTEKTTIRRPLVAFDPPSSGRGNGHVPVGPPQPRPLPRIVHTHTEDSKQYRTLPAQDALPAGWKHKHKQVRYDYHEGILQPSYSSATVTHKVAYYRPSPWDRVKDECWLVKKDAKAEVKEAKEEVKKWWSVQRF